MKKIKFIPLLILLIMTFCSCGSKNNEVVIYTAVDQVFSEEIFSDFEKTTGIHVNAVYDAEANKTTGLINRLKAEKKKPLCDVFWNNEFVQTIELASEDILEPYSPKAALDIPASFKDKNNLWTAFGGRARVFLVNTDLVKEENYPKGIYSFVDGSFEPSNLAIALPLFGTTKTMAAAIYATLGADAAKEYFTKIKESGVQIVDGNSVTKDMAASGQVMIGFTDTDDAKEAIEDGANVVMVFPDQEPDGIGTLIVPNTVAIIKNAPNRSNAEKFVEYVLSKEVEQKLIDIGFFDLSVREGGDFYVKGMDVSLNEIYDYLEISTNDLEEIFAR